MLDKGAISDIIPSFGGVAQLVERLNGIQEVRGSTPLISTKQVLDEHLFLQRRFRRKGDALIRNRNRHLRLGSKVAVLHISKSFENQANICSNKIQNSIECTRNKENYLCGKILILIGITRECFKF